jgi:hypothetical protein
LEEDIADDNLTPHTAPATIMAPAVPWSTKRVPVLETDAATIQAWIAAVRPIIAFHDASQLLINAVTRTVAGGSLARQIFLFLSKTIDGSLSSCLVDDDPAASWTALLALRPAKAKAIENTSATIKKMRLADTTVGDYTRFHRTATLLFTTWTPATTMPPYQRRCPASFAAPMTYLR